MAIEKKWVAIEHNSNQLSVIYIDLCDHRAEILYFLNSKSILVNKEQQRCKKTFVNRIKLVSILSIFYLAQPINMTICLYLRSIIHHKNSDLN